MLFGKVFVPPAVLLEWQQGSDQSPEEAAAAEGVPAGWLAVMPLVYEPLAVTQGNLGRGEVEVIALASFIGAEYAALDDLAARDFAMARGLRVIGTVGVLIAARRMGVIASVMPLLDELREAGFRLSDDVVEAARLDEESTAT